MLRNKKALVLIDAGDVKHLDIARIRTKKNIRLEVISYKRIFKRMNRLKDIVKNENIDYILYSRNDQVRGGVRIGKITKTLKVGYSSFSGIDDSARIEQMQVCFNDLCGKEAGVLLKQSRKKRKPNILIDTRPSFSLIFDTEQMGGVRFGLPRIIKALDKYDTKATFFVTNIVNDMYKIDRKLVKTGYEVGIHGEYHEYLFNKEINQEKQILKMIGRLTVRPVGANFIGRMNGTTIVAMYKNKLAYFVHPVINYYTFFSYPKRTTIPVQVDAGESHMTMVPISVETYGSKWPLIRNMIDSAIKKSIRDGTLHINILLHPFRDGSLKHIGDFEALLHYLINERKMVGITTKDWIKQYKKRHELTRIDYSELLRLGKFTARDLLPITTIDIAGMFGENVQRLLRGLQGLRQRYNL